MFRIYGSNASLMSALSVTDCCTRAAIIWSKLRHCDVGDYGAVLPSTGHVLVSELQEQHHNGHRMSDIPNLNARLNECRCSKLIRCTNSVTSLF